MTTVVLADDQPDVLAALGDVIGAHPALQLVGTAGDADGVVALACATKPDIAIVDWQMPGGGAGAAEQISRRLPGTRVIALSAYDDRAGVFQMLQAGASAYLVKGASVDEIHETIEQVMRGRTALDPQVSRTVAKGFVEQLTAEAVREDEALELSGPIRLALEPGRIEAVFQPIVELATSRPVGYEGLARFPFEPSRPPDAWFAAASDAGLGSELEVAALNAIAARSGDVPDDCYLSVNLSPVALSCEAAVAALGAFAPARLVVETTEHVEVLDYDALRAALEPLRARGVRLAIDDAGAGYACLQHILELAPDLIKIDRSVIARVGTDRGARAMISALVAFANEMGQEIVAEGIETAETARLVSALGVPLGQGYYFGATAS
jgi:EAL domain-containing protein (putative c-di-GMP-specific phosphodiesterase class I)/ActR/RegA family two-component response regulator